MITLEQLLESRDRRAGRQRSLLADWPASTLICLTVQLPGPVKRDRRSLLTGGAGLAELLNKFGSVLSHVQVQDLETGYEAYLLVPLDPFTVKRLCCRIEDSHPLGRLMDIDVLFAEKDGAVRALDRASVGLPPRRCLLCDNEVRYCMRARTHAPEALLDRIDTLLENFAIVGA